MDDLISRQAAIDVLKMDISIIPFAKAREYVQAAIETIYNRLEELPSAQQWIPVTERLPEANEKDENGFTKAYLVQDARLMDVARWDGEYWVAWGYGTVLKNITAWCPLPEPWKGGAE